jgi:hypothetical protein
MDLVEFLLARIAEDSSVAFFAQQDSQLIGPITDVLADRPADDHRVTQVHRWSQERVLAECESKRRIVDEAGRDRYPDDSDWDQGHVQGEDGAWQEALQLLALPYADHPDYQPEWKV